MPPIRSFTFEYYTLLTAFISLDGEIMSPYSYYTKKGLVCIVIIDPFGRQPSFYAECIKLNTYALCNIYLVSLNKYAFLYCTHYYTL